VFQQLSTEQVADANYPNDCNHNDQKVNPIRAAAAPTDFAVPFLCAKVHSPNLQQQPAAAYQTKQDCDGGPRHT
jgi:hypothetical protein